MLFCDICGCAIDKNNNYCIHCGNYIAIENICPVCNSINEDDATICVSCNAKLRPVILSSFDLLFTEENNELLRNKLLTESEYFALLKNIFYKYNFNYDDTFIVKNNLIKLVKNYAIVKSKSRGLDRGFSFGKIIFYDDRLDLSIQIATIIHELAHVLLGTILNEYLCAILDVKQSVITESFIWYCFNNDDRMKIMAEYCAHTVEGRFVPYGYQNYNSFNEIVSQTDLDINEIKEAMILANSYANEIIIFLEKFINEEFRESIKKQYKLDLNVKDIEPISLETDLSFNFSQKNSKISKLLLSNFENIDLNELDFIKQGLEEMI